MTSFRRRLLASLAAVLLSGTLIAQPQENSPASQTSTAAPERTKDQRDAYQKEEHEQRPDEPPQRGTPRVRPEHAVGRVFRIACFFNQVNMFYGWQSTTETVHITV